MADDAVPEEETFRVLVVDDEEVDRRAVRRGLRAAGLRTEVREAEDVASALAALRENGFDCVFLDFQLPGGDGLEVLRQAEAEGIFTPIVMLTGQEDTQTAVELMKAGAVDYLAKAQLSPERLERSLRHAIRIGQAEALAGRAEAALKQSEARFRVFHETSPDGFMIFRSVRGQAGEIVDFEWRYVNPTGERMVGRSASQLLRRGLLEEMPRHRETGLFEIYREVTETGEPQQLEMHYDHDGVHGWFHITAARLGDGFAVGFSDVTVRKQAEAERERVLGAQSRFYAAISHELRTPINAILGYNELILDGIYGPISEEQEHGLTRSQQAARHLLELVNDVLDLSKIEAGKVEVQPERVHVPELIQDLFATVRPLATEHGSDLELVFDDCVEPIVTDPRRVRQILLNLLSNALKFGQANPVNVHCTTQQEAGVVVEVVDRGVGIPPDEQERIFEEFVQLAQEQSGGTGLGLPISRSLAHLLGGKLEVESVPGQGSTFRLTLPRSIL